MAHLEPECCKVGDHGGMAANEEEGKCGEEWKKEKRGENMERKEKLREWKGQTAGCNERLTMY